MGLMKSGSLSDDGFHRLEMEMKQIKSYIASLTEQQPSKKSTREPSSRKVQGTSGSKDFLKALLMG
jgi:hypothetical protein